MDSVIEDKEFEKAILESNKFYEIKCDENDNEDGECYLELIEQYSGKVPSKKWLDSSKVHIHHTQFSVKTKQFGKIMIYNIKILFHWFEKSLCKTLSLTQSVPELLVNVKI